MTNLAVRCILYVMEEDNWTEQQLIDYIKKNGYPNFSTRQLKRFRKEKVVPGVCVDHLGFGPGTRTLYSTEAGPQVLEVCRLLEQKRKFPAVRFRLWLEGYLIELPVLKQTIRQLIPFLTWRLPRRTTQKEEAVDQLSETIMQNIEKSPRRHFLGAFLRRLQQKADQQSLVIIQVSFLYGLSYEFASGEHYHAESPEEALSSTEIMEQGLQLSKISFLSKNVTDDLNQLSSQGLLSLVKLNGVLEQATVEDIACARTRLAMLDTLLECFELMGYLTGPLLRFFRTHRENATWQALFLVFLLLLECAGYSDNMEIVFAAAQAALPALQRGQAIHLALQQELPMVAKELATLRQISQFTPQEQEAHMERLQTVYEQNQGALEAFWQRHPELSEREEQVPPDTASVQ